MSETLDFRALERESYGLPPQSVASIKLTPELIGRLVACIRQVYSAEPYEIVPPDFFNRLFLDPTTPVPESIADILHVETRVDGVHLEELTQMLVGPQASGQAGRLNPDTVNLIAKSDPLEAYLVLERYAFLFPQEVSWLKDTIKAAQQPVVEDDNDNATAPP
jgi:hypothetical protein